MKTKKWWSNKNELIIKLEKEIELKSKDIWFKVSNEYYDLITKLTNEYKKIN
jgi:hypothetical protein